MDNIVFDHQNELSKHAKKILFERVGKLGIKFGTRKNSGDLSVFINAVVQMSASKRCAPTAIKALKRQAYVNEQEYGIKTIVRSEDWVLKKIRDLDPNKVMSWCTNTASFITRHAQRESMINSNGMVAIDNTGNAYYGTGLKDETLKTKPKDGTSRFLSYMVSHLIDNDFDVPLSVRRIKKGDNIILCKNIQDIQRNGMDPKLYLADRGFANVKCILEFKRIGADFLMPMIKNKKVNKFILEHHNGERPAASSYMMKNKNGMCVTFNLLILKKNGRKESDDIIDQYVVFATSLPCETQEELIAILPEEYRKRWLIETAFRVTKSVQGKTCSNYLHVRLFLFHFALLLYSLWMMTKCINMRYGGLVSEDWIRMDMFAQCMCDMTKKIISEKQHGNFL